MGDLSKNFSRWEFACRDNCGFDSIDSNLVSGLQRLRNALSERYGRDVPIKINSGCRCETHNAALPGSSPYSQHLQGKAADIWSPGVSVDVIADAAEQLSCFAGGGIGVYRSRGFVHLDVRGWRARWHG